MRRASVVMVFAVVAACASRAQAQPVSTYPCSPSDPPAKFTTQVLPPGQMALSATAAVSVTVANCSGSTWAQTTAGGQGHKLVPQVPLGDPTWGITHVSLPSNVPTGHAVTLAFAVTAPAATGSYVFQWAIADGSNEGTAVKPYSPPALIGVGTPVSCPGALLVRDLPVDARATLQACIDATPSGHTLELPPGVYTLEDQLKMTRTMTLRTQGLAGNQRTCGLGSSPACARLKAAQYFPAGDESTHGLIQMVYIAPQEITLDHIVLDGNDAVRDPHEYWLLNPTLYYIANGGKFFHNAFVNTVAAQALGVVGTDNVIAYNAFLNSGYHFGFAAPTTYSDALFVHGQRNMVVYNVVQDATDVGIIFFGAGGTQAWYNSVVHSDPLDAAFGGLVLYWGLVNQIPDVNPYDYTGADIGWNYVNCNHRCNVAADVGGGAWSDKHPNLIGGRFHHNRIKRGLQGVSVGREHPTSTAPMLYDHNVVTESGGYATPAGWPVASTGTFNVTPNSNALLGSGNVPAVPDQSHDWPDLGFMFLTSNLANTPPFQLERKGSVDQTTCQVVRGWACSEWSYFSPIEVHVYMDGPFGQGGVFAGSTWAELDRPDLAAADVCAGSSNHGFAWTVPAKARDGQPHTLYFYGVSSGGYPLTGSPVTVHCSAD